MADYDVGDRVRVAVAFTVSDVATDPTAVYFRYRIDSGSTTTLTYGVDAALQKDSTGNYHVDLDVTTAGTYYCRFNGTGTCYAAEKTSFNVVGWV